MEKYGFKVHSAYIGQVREKLGIHIYENYNDSHISPRKPTVCPAEKEVAIVAALQHFGLLTVRQIYWRNIEMKDIVIIYDKCCLYEIANTNYYLSYTGADVDFVGIKNDPVKSMEGFSLNPDYSVEQIDISEIRSLIIPGGNIQNIRTNEIMNLIKKVFASGKLVAAICAAVDLIEDTGILNGLSSTHSTDADCISDKNVITARANAYVDFGIEVAKYLDLFTDEADLQETIAFWKYFQRMD